MVAELLTHEGEFQANPMYHKETFNSDGQVVRYSIEQPAGEPRDDVAFLFVNGWTAPASTYERPRHELVLQTGYPAITLDDPHGRTKGRVEDALFDNLSTVCNDAGFEQYIMVGHSKGGLVSVRFAHRYHNDGVEIAGLSLHAPAGIAKDRSLSVAAKRVFVDHALQQGAHFIKNPYEEVGLMRGSGLKVVRSLGRSMAEGVYAAQEKAHGQLIDLAINADMPLHAVLCKGDKILLLDEMQEGFKNIMSDEDIDVLDGRYCHNAIVRAPKQSMELVSAFTLRRIFDQPAEAV